MISWIGAICSAASLFYQYQTQKNKEQWRIQLVKLILELSRKLKNSKEVHACFQTSYYTHFVPFVRKPMEEFVKSAKQDWGVLYDAYNKNVSDHKIGAIRTEKVESKDELQKTIDEQYEGTSNLKYIIDKTDLTEFIRNYSRMIRFLSELDTQMNTLALDIADGTYSDKSRKSLKDRLNQILLDADSCMKVLIDIQERIISRISDQNN